MVNNGLSYYLKGLNPLFQVHSTHKLFLVKGGGAYFPDGSVDGHFHEIWTDEIFN